MDTEEEVPQVVNFQVKKQSCKLGLIDGHFVTLNLGVAVVTFDSIPEWEITTLEPSRSRVVIGNAWFDTDEVAAQRIKALLEGAK